MSWFLSLIIEVADPLWAASKVFWPITLIFWKVRELRDRSFAVPLSTIWPACLALLRVVLEIFVAFLAPDSSYLATSLR